MATHVRKNLMVNADQIRALARLRGTSESEAVREAVTWALAAAELEAAMTELAQAGGIDDVFQQLPAGEGAGRGATADL
jgi:hypothetical protein